MNRLSTPRAARLFACLLFGLLCLAANPSQAATINNPAISVVYKVYNGGMYGMEYVDKVSYGFNATWSNPQTNAYCNYFITVIRDFYDVNGMWIGLTREQMYQSTGNKPSPVNVNVSDQPFGYADYSVYTRYRPQGTKFVIIWYELKVVVADGINVYADTTKLSASRGITLP